MVEIVHIIMSLNIHTPISGKPILIFSIEIEDKYIFDKHNPIKPTHIVYEQ